MEEVVLKAEPRTITGKQVNALRRKGVLPAVLYGKRFSPVPVALDLRETSRILNQISSSALIKLQLGDESHMVLVRDKQRNFLTGELMHVDFQVVSMLDKIRADVALQFAGEAPAVKEWGATLVTEMNEISIECFPQDLPEVITVDVSVLRGIGDTIKIKDLALPANVEILHDPNEIVVVATAPEAEVEEVEAGFAEPEVIERGKKEEEEF